MKKAEKILEKHIVLNDCIGYLGSDGRLYKAIINALEEAINYTRCCTELCEKCNKENNLQKLTEQAQDLDLGYD
tara:strand:- start:542 stop:763 length:222 start_codon:yes stop_codon:yes gene_type:complete